MSLVVSMKLNIGYCIRICNECEIFKVTQADDDQKRAVMADDFSEMFDQISSLKI
jgi:hypothetical protein